MAGFLSPHCTRALQAYKKPYELRRDNTSLEEGRHISPSTLDLSGPHTSSHGPHISSHGPLLGVCDPAISLSGLT